jgi:hypothetical protein
MADEKHTEQGLATRFLIPKYLGRTQMNYKHALELVAHDQSHG